MTRVFISHATSDGAGIAGELVRELEAQGQPCWMAPRDIVPGRTYAGQIVAALEAAQGVVLVVAPAANISRDVAQEIQLAHAREKVIVPFIVDRTVPAGDLAYFLALRHQVHWTTVQEAAASVVRSFGGQSAVTVLDAAAGVAAAAAHDEGVAGTFEMTVRSTGEDDDGRWLNSEADYRDPRNLGVRLAGRASDALSQRLGGYPLEVLAGRRIRVTGTAIKTRIVFLSGGKPTDRYYFQTHLEVADPGQIEPVQS